MSLYKHSESLNQLVGVISVSHLTCMHLKQYLEDQEGISFSEREVKQLSKYIDKVFVSVDNLLARIKEFDKEEA